MPIKRVAVVLCALVALSLLADLAAFNLLQANNLSIFSRAVPTSVGTSVTTPFIPTSLTPSPDCGNLIDARYKFITKAKRPRQKDSVSFVIDGINLQAGDGLAFALLKDNEVAIGDAATVASGDVLVLDNSLKATGQLNVNSPASMVGITQFLNARALYKADTRRLTVRLTKGLAQNTPVNLSSGLGAVRFASEVFLRVDVQRDGVLLRSCYYQGQWQLRNRLSRKGQLTQSGKLLSPAVGMEDQAIIR